MTKKKKRYIRNGIVYDPNIKTDIFDYDYEDSLLNRKTYLKGKIKRKRYFGI